MSDKTERRTPDFTEALEEAAQHIRTARTLAKATVQAMPDKKTAETEEAKNLLLALWDQLDLAQTALEGLESI